MSKITRFWLLAFLVAFPFGRLTLLPDICVVGLLFSWLLGWRSWHRGVKPELLKSIWFFLLACLPSLIGHFSWPGLFYWLRLAAYCQLYWVVADLKGNYRQCLLAAGIGAAAFGLTQYCLWPDLRLATIWGWDPHYFRAVGTFFDPNFLGIILVLTLVLLFEQPSWFGFSFTYLVLALTYSRSAFLAFLTAAAVKKNLKVFLAAGLLLGLTVLVLPQGAGGEGVKLTRTRTLWARWENYQQAFTLISQNFFWGTGFQTRRVDNSFLFIWANAGLFSFLAFLYLLKQIASQAQKKFFLTASLAAIFVDSFFVNAFFYPPVLAWLMISLGSRLTLARSGYRPRPEQ
ncbi:hypothetical protein COU97_02120 [Candidatus Shapirobacteria bacterium CG10_big_fil_rev_8_21_14_0_10_48_15]|uniref:Uncharacterized protein n=1 Tax=Candidatus Shapirobacteria bacterium CG10_big_fil_rev_8_21_14_0_10_48_15 TaxID=1974484 RepID=A0A2M8L704_9BACT|nr:MAG: hypothetical protein COU97_02120 [Candidatus Shapirobacteria bacterium CG10_big_fil_rev_8_21_14_0_10_48_15]